ncbi:MAG: hypothetical protein ACR2QF_17600 [Geminicoccaceae bacterium]
MAEVPIEVTLVAAIIGQKVVKASDVDGSAYPDGTIPEWQAGDMQASTLASDSTDIVTLNSSWRMNVSSGAFTIEHFEPLDEANITLDDVKVASITGNAAYTADTAYYASVLTDARFEQSSGDGIDGDMTGRVCSWDGFVWVNFPDQWVEKTRFQNSMFIDRGVFQRMNIARTDPDDTNVYPPRPEFGTNLGGRRDGGVEHLAYKTKTDTFGALCGMNHSEAPNLLLPTNQMATVEDVGIPVSWTWDFPFFGFNLFSYQVGDVAIRGADRYVCNTAGPQFFFEPDKWDLANPVSEMDFNRIVTADGQVVTDGNGDVVYIGQPGEERGYVDPQGIGPLAITQHERLALIVPDLEALP